MTGGCTRSNRLQSGCRCSMVRARVMALTSDLVVVAVLTVFSASHELAAVSDIPNFLGFFTVVYWVWVSQTHYDMRFQGESKFLVALTAANDTLNRLFKFPQICVFIYQGATSGNWDPKNIQSEDPSTVEGAEHLDNYNSFNGVLIALIVSRGLLAAQFLIGEPNIGSADASRLPGAQSWSTDWLPEADHCGAFPFHSMYHRRISTAASFSIAGSHTGELSREHL